jgi:hypothetical protein
MADSNLYTFKREADRWVLLPTPLYANLMTGFFAAGSLFMLYLSTMFFRRVYADWSQLLIGGIFVLVAALIASSAIRAWRTRRIPISIEAGGRVSYGEQELCAAGTVRTVRIATARAGEANDCELAFELAGGELVYLPSQYFCFSVREHARPFASELAKALEVQVTESY